MMLTRRGTGICETLKRDIIIPSIRALMDGDFE